MIKSTGLKIGLLAGSIALHVLILSFSINLKEPVILEEIYPAFPMIEAVLIEEPQPIVSPPSPPPPKIEIPPEPEIVEEINEAVIPDIEAEETEEEEEIEEEVEEIPPPLPEPLPTSEASSSSNTEGSVEVPATNFIPFYRVEKRPEFVQQAELEYPPQAQRMRLEGRVILEADIDAEGQLIQVRVVKEAGFGFDEAAMDMLKASVFSPAMMDGRPVGVRMRFTIQFSL